MSIGSCDGGEDGLIERIFHVEFFGKISIDGSGRKRRVLDLDRLRFGVFGFWRERRSEESAKRKEWERREHEGEGRTFFSSYDLQQSSEIENVISRPFRRGLQSELEFERSDDGLEEVLLVPSRKKDEMVSNENKGGLIREG